MLQYLPFAGLALVLGFKHSYDADHILAVSNLLKDTKSLKHAAKMGLYWASGHMITATILTIILYSFKESLLEFILPHFEKIVGVMLIILGLFTMKGCFHSHKHEHDGKIHKHPHIHCKKDMTHSHKHIFGIGIIQGLASNDELLMLLVASLGMTTLGGMILGIGFFSLGVVAGMILFSAIVTYPLFKSKNEKISIVFSFIVGFVSIIYGFVSLIKGL